MPDPPNDSTSKPEPNEHVPHPPSTTNAPTQPIDLSDDKRPPSGQQAKRPSEVEGPAQNEDEGASLEEDIDPADQIDAFDWDALHERYHEAMTNASAQEAALMQEFAQLMNVPCLFYSDEEGLQRLITET